MCKGRFGFSLPQGKRGTERKGVDCAVCSGSRPHYWSEVHGVFPRGRAGDPFRSMDYARIHRMGAGDLLYRQVSLEPHVARGERGTCLETGRVAWRSSGSSAELGLGQVHFGFRSLTSKDPPRSFHAVIPPSM